MISPLSANKFRLYFAAIALVFMIMHAFVVTQFGYDIETALIDSAVSNVGLIVFCLLIVNGLRYYLPKKERFFNLLMLCLISTSIWLGISALLLKNINPQVADAFSGAEVLRFGEGLLVLGCVTLISVLWYTLEETKEQEQRKSEAEQLARDAELYKLRQQLQPHFLFNSLNSISALIGTQPALARTMIQQLSDFLRGTLRKEEYQWVSLQEELQHLQLYLDIEKVRFGHRLSTRIESCTDCGNMRLPSMILQPIVENAIKFGLYDTIEAITIEIIARKQGSELSIQVRNPFDPETTKPGSGTGFGLSSVQRRLFLLFGRTDLLRTAADGTLFITQLQIPQP